ncbi:Alcohol dehydrogenase superfamily, zinc-type [Akanthomyces lecanii RCEF 1005]|uniref:Alcohol dehydrogenase superfamily, zinc-type n=1 Tax=Akanthomyces lecanii RCEF 1005 TaxID=1081108 RepID=A0A167RSM9_CORDF|nr:Alcohol dehydrogenase superfamily, zinc-type [Akanthomyces lecanii RCEF 1005]
MTALSQSHLPTTHSAIKVESQGQVTVAESEPLPTLGPLDVLVHNVCVGLNPYDSKSVDMSPSQGATIGGDFAGEIVALGADVPSGRFTIGQRVFGCVFGNNPDRRDNGAFSEYVAAPADFVVRIPDGMSFQQAATLGIGLATTGMALFKNLELPMPNAQNVGQAKSTNKKPVTVLVYGGGTATAALAIQVLRRSGFKPVTTCSPHNFDHVKELGAEEAFNYKSPTCGSEIKEYTKDKLGFVLDCIATSDSMKVCYEAIGSKGGRYVSLDPFPLHGHTRRSVQPDWLFLFTQFGEAVNWQRPYSFDARPRDKAVATRWYRVAEQMLLKGDITPHHHQEQEGGLAAVIDGMDAVRKGEVSGYKLVYPIRNAA